jgi:hypothetical protein
MERQADMTKPIGVLLQLLVEKVYMLHLSRGKHYWKIVTRSRCPNTYTFIDAELK